MSLSQRKRAVFIVLATAFVTTLASCKIEVTPGVGGAVVAESGLVICFAGETCTVDVSTTDFDETFSVVPAEGYEFVGWKRRPRGFCGGNIDPCHLFTSGFVGNGTLLGFLEDEDQTFFLSPEFRFVAEGDSSTYFDIAESGEASGIVTADGNVAWTTRREDGTNSIYTRAPDGSELYVIFGADDLPQEIHFEGLFLRIRQFTDTAVIAEVIDAAGNGAVGEIPLTEALRTVLASLSNRGNATSSTTAVDSPAIANEVSAATGGGKQLFPGRDSTLMASNVFDLFDSFASDDLKDGVDAVKLADEILSSASLRPLLADASKETITKLTGAFVNHLESKGDQQTSVDLQLRVLAGAGTCYLSLAGGPLLSVGGLAGCEDFVKASHAVVNSWAVRVVENQYRNTLDALAEQAPLFDNEFAATVQNQLVPTREVLGDYSHEIVISAPRENEFIQLTQPLLLETVVADRVTEAPISRSRTIEVDYVDAFADEKRMLRVDRRGFLSDIEFGGADDPKATVDIPNPDRPVRTEGLLRFSVTGLSEGRRTLGIAPSTLGIHSSKRVSVIATPFEPPFRVRITPTQTNYNVGDQVVLQAGLFADDGRGPQIPDVEFSWVGPGADSSDQETYTHSFLTAGSKNLTATGTYYDVPFSGQISLQLAAQSVAGNWRITAIEDERGCDEGVNTITVTLPIEQNGNTVTVLGIPASITGNTISWSGVMFPEDGGTTTSSATLTLAADFNSFAGTETWSFRDGSFSCSGTTEITGQRVN
ncbi:MAG: hypothetical protein AAF098_14650 [Pseudomonadota bacterium]